MIIAIDGPAGCGKSTLAKDLAERLGIIYIDTGATYRAAAFAVLRHGLDDSRPEEVAGLVENSLIELIGKPGDQRVFLDGQDVSGEIRTPEVSDMASRISALTPVRRSLVELQRKIAEGNDVVLEGRDTGSVVFPNADLKIYLDASVEERAKRRAGDWDIDTDLKEIESEIALRDERDRTRSDSPLTVADDAVIIDSTNLTIVEVLELVIAEMHVQGLQETP